MTTTYDQLTVTYDQSSLTYQGLPAQFDGVAFAVEMGFGYSPFTAVPSWESVTPYVRGFSTDRGRTSEFVDYSPGTASILLDNRDRRFDPEYTSGPYYGQLNPMVPVRIQATYSGVTYTMYTGFVQGWPTAYNQSNTDAVASINCVDANRLLENIPVLPADYVQAVLADEPNEYWTLQQPTRITQAGEIRGQTISIPGSQQFLQEWNYAIYNNAPFGAEASYNADPFGAAGFVGDPPPETFRIRTMEHWFNSSVTDLSPGGTAYVYHAIDLYFQLNVNTSSKQISPAVYSVQDRMYIPFYSVSYSAVERVGANHLVVTYDPSTAIIRIVVNGQQIDSRSMTVYPGGTVSFGGPVISDPLTQIEGEGMSHFALYTSTLTNTQALAHYNAGVIDVPDPSSDGRIDAVLDQGGWPTGLRDLQTGTVNVAAYRPDNLSTLAYLRLVATAEQGALFINNDGKVRFLNRDTLDTAVIAAIFDDNGTDLPFSGVTVDAHTVDAIRNVVQGAFRGRYKDETLLATDAASVTAYGDSSESLNLTLVDSQTEAEAVLAKRLARAKDPRTRITSLSVNMRRDPANLVPAVASLDLADDVVVSLTPTGVGDPLWRAVSVQGLSHTVTPQSWDVTMYLAPGPIATNGPLMILDDSVYGQLDNNKLG